MSKNAKKYLRDYLIIIFGAAVLGAVLNVLLVPMKISGGGFGTIATILYHLFSVQLSVSNLVLNVALLAFSLKILGRAAFLKTVVGTLSLSLFLELTKKIPIPQNLDFIMVAVIGGVIVGIGLGLVIRVGGSTGGTDLLGVIIRRFLPHLPIGVIIFSLDCVIICISGIVFRSIEVTFYSALVMFIGSKVCDFVMNMGRASKSLYVISAKHEDIKKMILGKYNRGVTELFSRGGYSGEEGITLLCAVSPKEVPKIVRAIKEVDSKAFIIINDAREVLGEGFL
jgi:uncharacterized membrane-anchored protein YitT (DUF2179 family)